MPTSINRDHIVRIPPYYLLFIFLQVSLAAAIVVLMLPYTGPEDEWPDLHRFVTLACATTFAFSCYYLLGAYAFPPAYSCWLWLVCSIWQVLEWISVWGVITYDAGRISWQLRVSSGHWMTDSEFAEFTWIQRVALKYYIASVVSGIQASVAIACLIMYSKALSFHRHSGAPYLFHGRWRTTDDNPSINIENLGREGDATGRQDEDPFADGQYEGSEHPIAPSQSYEMRPQPQGDAPRPANAKEN